MSNTARIRAGWPKISPDGGLISFLIESISDSSDALIATAPGGATIRVNGGSPVTLADPLFSASTYDNLISYPLNPAPQIWIKDESEATAAGAATPTTLADVIALLQSLGLCS